MADEILYDPKTAGYYCATHPNTQLICPSCIASIAGKATSKAKTRASRKNGLLGGRPKNLRGGRPKKLAS